MCGVAAVHPAAAQSVAPERVWHQTAGLAPDTHDVRDLTAQAQAELELGRPERALEALAAVSEGVPSPRHLELSAQAAYGVGDYAGAAELFSRAAAYHTGWGRGVLVARAGDAFERTGVHDSAASRYREAARSLAPIAGWLAIREARVTAEPVRAFALLRRAPPEAHQAAMRVRAPLLLAAGDTSRAVGAFREAGAYAAAARLAVARGDGASARALLDQSLEHESAEALEPLLAALDSVPWPTAAPADLVALAQAYRRVGRPDDALEVLERARAGARDTMQILLLLGDVLAETGHLREAEAHYARAAGGEGPHAVLAERRLADVLGRLGQTAARWEALAGFAREHPRHRDTPRTLFLLGERYRDRGERRQSDSVMQVLQRQWPDHVYGSQARLALAASALARRDTTRAAEWYREEIAVRGDSWRVAQFLLAQVEAALGHDESARSLYHDLARRDSLGYYGVIAREELGLPVPASPPPAPTTPSAQIVAVLERLDLLIAAGFREEAEALVAFHLQPRNADVEAQLAFGAGLIERGWVAEAIRLAWRLADTLTLHDGRVLRLIYPWPLRGLIEREAAEHGLDPYLLAALIRQESAFRPHVTSRAGARGLMQLMPTTASWLAGRLGVEWDDRFLTVADANLHLGAVHLAGLLDGYDGNVVFALAAYNAGGRPVNRWRRLPEARDPHRFVERIPYAETQGFVRAVLRNRHIYRMLYPEDGATP